ncbi:CapA family protein [Barnesiella sp. ET7]|uniref:CapA family protein n=1 Tax=Barnesiella sp. ET7 TaxID=2972460 RepID=UPI0021ACE1C3|nr:CapA family protein [Barnesiella sp. ET7]MCR8912365.1 CapA family protein [Barnesiella sp. ET7]
MTGLVTFLAPLLLGQTPVVPATAVSLLFAGDAMQHQAQITSARTGEGYDYSGCFELIAPEVSAADYAVVNLEAPTGGAPYTGYPCFSAPDEFPAALQQAGFDLFLTANNHCLDRQSRGARRTLQRLDSLGVDHIGTYESDRSLERFHPFVTNIKGIRIAFLNYTYGTNGFTPTPPLIVNYIDRARIKHDIRRARELQAELIVACLHWGNEYQLLPNATQKELADLLVDEGVQLVIGAHPHVIQPMELRCDKQGNPQALVVYSLGNFISNMKTRDTVGGALVKVTVARDPINRVVLKSAQYTLVYTRRPVTAADPFVVVPAEQEVQAHPQRPHLKGFLQKAREIFSLYNRGVKEYFIKTRD